MDKLSDVFNLVNLKELLQFSQPAMHILLILVMAWVLLRFSGKAIRMLKAYLRSQADNNLEDLKRIETLSRVFRYIASVVIYVVSGMVVLSELGISIAPILATAGVLGLAVGFGAQSLIKDYFNGIFLLLENQVRQGDVVEAGGKAGLVEEVTLRYIKMRDYDGNVHFIPNGIITTVTNMSRGFAYAVIDVGVAYREDMDEVMDVMRQVGAGMREDETFGGKMMEPMEMAGVDRWDDSAVILRCRFKVLPLEQWGVRREYLRRLKQAFDRHGIEIPYPHLTVYAGQAKDGSAAPLHLVQRTETA
ncbi:MAG: mechanosensitive ion channel family protein [Gammaproteobacteria bacterium]|nr:mechanosensitive ion channel family protein [Gammaproteobacteria bacterium]